MPRKDLVPKQDAAFLAKHDLMKAGLAVNGTALGFSAGEITAFTTKNTSMHTTFAAVDTLKAAYDAGIDSKNMDRVTGEALYRAYAGRAKKSPGYTPAIGAAWGIIGEEDTTDLHTLAPEIKGRDLGGGHAEIQFGKKTADAVWIECKRGTETVHSYLASDTHSPYIDNRPLLDPTKPELRNYRLKFMRLGEVVGNYSEELVINCAP